MTDAPVWEPPLAASESEHLIGMLERLRATFRWKVDGLDDVALRFQLPTSQLSLGGLLKHLAMCEDDSFAWKMLGERPLMRDFVDVDADVEQWQFTLLPHETATQAYWFYDQAVVRSQRAWRRIVDEDKLDAPAHLHVDDLQPSIRRFLCDLIEEYGRHTGHADLLREAIDGRVGEDPPASWQAGYLLD